MQVNYLRSTAGSKIWLPAEELGSHQLRQDDTAATDAASREPAVVESLQTAA
jgi:hypothetical protein